MIAAATMGVTLTLVVMDPFTAVQTLPPTRLKLLLVFVGALLGVEMFASWMPDSLSIKMNNDD